LRVHARIEASRTYKEDHSTTPAVNSTESIEWRRKRKKRKRKMMTTMTTKGMMMKAHTVIASGRR
jgi:hypothetical protein